MLQHLLLASFSNLQGNQHLQFPFFSPLHVLNWLPINIRPLLLLLLFLFNFLNLGLPLELLLILNLVLLLLLLLLFSPSVIHTLFLIFLCGQDDRYLALSLCIGLLLHCPSFLDLRCSFIEFFLFFFVYRFPEEMLDGFLFFFVFSFFI